jgi:hypothetical protein
LWGKKSQVEKDYRGTKTTLDQFEEIEKFLPDYLLNPEKENLKKLLRENFPFSTDSSIVYGKVKNLNLIYQGDGVLEIPFFNIEENSNVETLYFDAIVLSNTCSVNPNNVKTIEPDVNFGLVLSLDTFIEYLREKDVNAEKIQNFTADVKKNQVNNVFFLPSFERNGYQFPDSIVRFDKISSIPLSKLTNYDWDYHTKGDRLFSFSDYGFYLFLFKLSVFFCRFGEGTSRNN